MRQQPLVQPYYDAEIYPQRVRAYPGWITNSKNN